MRVLDILLENNQEVPQEQPVAGMEPVQEPAQSDQQPQPAPIQAPVAQPVPVAQPATVQQAVPQQNPLLATITNDLDEIEDASQENEQFEKIAVEKIKELIKLASDATGAEPPINEESQSEIAASIATLEDQVMHLVDDPKYEGVVSTIRTEIQKLREKIAIFSAKEREAGGEEVKNKFRMSEEKKLEYANSIASRVGKSEEWAASLVGVVSGFGNELSSKFLEACASGTAMTVRLEKLDKVDKKRLPSLVSSDVRKIFSEEHKKVLRRLIKLPFTESTGFGGGVAPGESLLACLIPGASSAAKGDLHIDGANWEVKAGSYGDAPSKVSWAWLDAQALTPNELKTVFIDACKEALRGSKIGLNKTITVGDNTYTLMDFIKLSDFRATKLSVLKAVFKEMKPAQREEVLSSVYTAMAPTVGQRRPKEFSEFVSKSLNAIDSLNISELAKLQTKLSMTEYGLNDYQSPNFIFFNSTTLDVMFVRGIASFNRALGSKYNLKLQTMTMGGGTKASPGIFLAGDNEEEVEKIIGFVRKRPKVTEKSPKKRPSRSKKSAELAESLREIDEFMYYYF